MERLSEEDLQRSYQIQAMNGDKLRAMIEEIRALREVEKAARQFRPCLSHDEPQGGGPFGLCFRCDLKRALSKLPELPEVERP